MGERARLVRAPFSDDAGSSPRFGVFLGSVRTTDPTKLQRWLDLIGYLFGRRHPVSVDEVLEHVPAYASPLETDDPKTLDATRKMFERDKSELRAFGIPIETV